MDNASSNKYKFIKSGRPNKASKYMYSKTRYSRICLFFRLYDSNAQSYIYIYILQMLTKPLFLLFSNRSCGGKKQVVSPSNKERRTSSQLTVGGVTYSQIRPGKLVREMPTTMVTRAR